jgi:LuxR family maltose regulon positive regulatory protein
MGNAIISINAMSKLAHLQFIQGNLYAAAESYHESLQTLERWGWENQAVTGLITSGMALLLYEWNTLNQALTYAQTSLKQLKRWGHASHITETQILLAAIEEARGDTRRSESYLESASTWAQRHRERHIDRWILEARARIALSRGDRSEALGYYDQIAHRFPNTGTQGSLTRLYAVRPLILNHDYDRAEAILTAWQAYTARRGLTTQRIKATVLQAMNAQAQDQYDTALARLQDALILAEPGGFVRTFVDEGPIARDLLRLAAERDLEPSRYIARLVDTFSADRPASIEPLSDREDEVLQLIADQRSNREIAEALFISVNTVKTHIRRLYNKLGANSRLEAVMRAQELGLL